MMNDDIDLTNNYIKIGEFRVNKDQVGCQFNNPFLLEMVLQDFIEQLDAQYEHCRKGQDDIVMYIQTDVYRKKDAETLDDVWEDDLQFVFVQKVVLDEIIEIVDDEVLEEEECLHNDSVSTECRTDSTYCKKKYDEMYTSLGYISVGEDIQYHWEDGVNDQVKKTVRKHFERNFAENLQAESKESGKSFIVVIDTEKGRLEETTAKEHIVFTKMTRL